MTIKYTKTIPRENLCARQENHNAQNDNGVIQLNLHFGEDNQQYCKNNIVKIKRTYLVL